MEFLPILLELREQPCRVVGGDEVAARKALQEALDDTRLAYGGGDVSLVGARTGRAGCARPAGRHSGRARSAGHDAAARPLTHFAGQAAISEGTLPTSRRKFSNGPMLPIASIIGPSNPRRWKNIAAIGPYSPLPISTQRPVSAFIT